MTKDDVNDYLTQGIYGRKEIKPQEKIEWLGTFRERVVIALTQKQVKKDQVYPEIEQMILKYPKATMLLNGEMEYGYLSKYISLADRYKLPFRMVSDHETDTDMGLVLACPDAVDLENILVAEGTEEEKPEAKAKDKGLSSFFANLFK